MHSNGMPSCFRFFAAASPDAPAPMDAPPNTYFAYATAPGNVAEDGFGVGEQGWGKAGFHGIPISVATCS